MRYVIVIPREIERAVKAYLFRDGVEQGVFLFSRTWESPDELSMEAIDYYLIPSTAWEEQSDFYLQLKDSERARIMKRARDLNLTGRWSGASHR